MTVFVDSSALVKRYFVERGSAWLRATIGRAERVVVARITFAEVPAALVRPVRPPTMAGELVAQFERDAATFEVVEVTPAIVARARDLILAHRLRGYDAVQLSAALAAAAALTVQGLERLDCLISADAELNRAALAEGLAVEDPNDHP